MDLYLATKAVLEDRLTVSAILVYDAGAGRKIYFFGGGGTFVPEEMAPIEWDDLAEALPDKDRERVKAFSPGTYIFNASNGAWVRSSVPAPAR